MNRSAERYSPQIPVREFPSREAVIDRYLNSLKSVGEGNHEHSGNVPMSAVVALSIALTGCAQPTNEGSNIDFGPSIFERVIDQIDQKAGDAVDSLKTAIVNGSSKIFEEIKLSLKDDGEQSSDDSETAPDEENEDILNTPYSNPASKVENGNYELMDSDNGFHEVDLSEAIGFTPDVDLRLSDIQPAELNPIPADAVDFQAYLNSERDGFGPLAGFTDGTNDYNQYYNHESGPQLPAYSWMVHTGLMVEIPGIGKVVGGEGRAVMVLILNRTDDVHRFETNSVKVIAGFQGWGRIWNGEADYVQETEKRLTNHYRERLGNGVPETGFIGQCDQGEENCNEVTVVAVERIQWGQNEDGSPRYQFRLIRAETVSTPSR